MTNRRHNHFPIVLVHGFTGWGRNELFGYKYWGGFRDIQQSLTKYGYKTHTASVGPISSNWDRACELYAQLMGGTVDYGAVHAKKYGHARFGRTYPGLFPDWGQFDPDTGAPKRIHLIGHSMGGQTARVLVHLLTNGSQEEIEATLPDQLSPLFAGGHSIVESVTTISTPHDGTSLTCEFERFLSIIEKIIGGIAALNSAVGEPVYDFKLDQWGLHKQPNESWRKYVKRVLHSPIWSYSKDLSGWDLSPDGSKQLNTVVRAVPDVYYLSFATAKTFKNRLTGHEDPELTMNPLFDQAALFMGSYTRQEPGHVPITSSWWRNDGVVNTVSMDGPKGGSTDEIVHKPESVERGRWNFMGTMDRWDHFDIIGIPGLRSSIIPWYLALADTLGSLPSLDACNCRGAETKD